MKEFDIELAKQGHPVCTRDGRKARIICFDRKSLHHPIVALITNDANCEQCEYYKENGTYSGSSTTKCDVDLMMASQKHEGWVNIYAYAKTGTKHVGEKIFDTEKDAQIYGTECTNYLITIKIEWEE